MLNKFEKFILKHALKRQLKKLPKFKKISPVIIVKCVEELYEQIEKVIREYFKTHSNI